MIQQFTQEARAGIELDALADGRRVAFVSIIGVQHTAALAVAIEGQAGMVPVPEELAHADSLRAMQLHADRLNISAGIGRREAAVIVASTFAEAA